VHGPSCCARLSSGQSPASAPPFSTRCRAVRFDVRGVDHLGVCRSPVSGKFPEQIFPVPAPRPAHEAVIDRRRRPIDRRAIRFHCSSLSQNKFLLTISNPSAKESLGHGLMSFERIMILNIRSEAAGPPRSPESGPGAFRPLEAVTEQAQREASPTAAVIDSQSVKSAEKGGPSSIRTAMMRARRSRVRSDIFS
jgi:hypothetical protein